MVSSAHPLATQAGAKMLEMGGNAADAAVATAFALAVVEPSMSGIGGRQVIMIRKADGSIQGIDATTQAPESYDPDADPEATDGYPTIGIPGVVAGLTRLLEEHGTMDLKTVMQPAIDYATNGYVVKEGQGMMYNMVKDLMAKYPGTREYYMKNDSTPYQAGDTYKNPTLASTLSKIAEGGRDAFYKGEIAEKIAADMAANGGYVDMQALAQYEAKTATLVSGSYRGYDLKAMWLPSFGAITVEILHILENLPMDELKGADWASATFQAIDLAYEDRRKQFEDGALELLTSKEYAATLAEKINIKDAPEPEMAQRPEDRQDNHLSYTTHMSAADKSGLVISLTQTLGPIFGSKVAAPDLGFVYANTMGPYLGNLGPGERASSHISPIIVLKDNNPFLVLGCAGGARIIPAIVSVISRKIDHQLSLEDALASPRVYPTRDSVELEMHEGWGWKTPVVETLQGYGFGVLENPNIGRFGRVHAIEYDESGSLTGAADPDWMGSASGPSKE